ncbi:MAG: hypothetical protein K2X56_06085 [Mycobacterium pseudokansasii]|uniref:Uncharacterized protein n=1 Tax=Mycobacterium pseudokansasii TaxID=2341080 RepID=A0A498QSD1_9MYCO|nr:hypothetical protein [Mycobacterium pseudokansasii]KZS65118.1 hypothetical protein A4G27_27055 [Mycobacterium kansasii]MBY0387669.1 hypothetical protein [Mycobacterium pseudokansasii]VAZ95032.1 hypothetical protein LAUMK35_02825 [Mycobacterium pseudokansasii]VAZ96182.1 hypothetical protein LAUMK21_02825 [Mycobacterium pseudokansasii]VBA50625.1 hypothetical protein LAUMK142_02721 [Mycobacterium pseudokansasii]
MNTTSFAAITDFEVYLLMTTKLRMIKEEARFLHAKLAEFGLSVSDAESTHKRVSETLGDKASYFQNMKKLLGVADSGVASLEYSSVLWPGFDFKASASEEGVLESARYWHMGRDSRSVESPIGLPTWSVDITEFAEHFGPLTGGQKWSLFDKLLPGHEEYEFQWDGERYGAAFSWGLFLWVTKLWPED